MNGYISVAEAAERLGVCRMTVRRWARAGRIQAVRVGPRIVRVNEVDVALMVRPMVG